MSVKSFVYGLGIGIFLVYAMQAAFQLATLGSQHLEDLTECESNTMVLESMNESCEEMLTRACMTDEDCGDIAADIEKRTGEEICHRVPADISGPSGKVCGQRCAWRQYQNFVTNCIEKGITQDEIRIESCIGTGLALSGCHHGEE